MSDEKEDLWAVITSRDAALASTHRLYQKWIAALNEANASTKAYLAVVEEDRAARLSALLRLQRQLDEHGLQRHVAEAKLAELMQAHQGATDHFRSVDADRQARLEVIIQLQAKLDAAGLAHHQAEARVRQLEEELAGTRKYLDVVEMDRAERLRVIAHLQAELDGRSTTQASSASPNDAA